MSDWLSSWSDSIGLLPGIYHFYRSVFHLHLNGLVFVFVFGAVIASSTVFVKVFHHNVGVVRARTDQAEEDGEDNQTLQNGSESREHHK